MARHHDRPDATSKRADRGEDLERRNLSGAMTESGRSLQTIPADKFRKIAEKVVREHADALRWLADK